MTVSALRVVAWSAALLGVGVVGAFIPPHVPPDGPVALKTTE